MAYRLLFTVRANRELAAIRVFDRNRIIETIENQLTQSPAVLTRNRKTLNDISAEFVFIPPLHELRVGNYRVFYDIDESEQTVYIRSVRLKEHGQTTEEVTHA